MLTVPEAEANVQMISPPGAVVEGRVPQLAGVTIDSNWALSGRVSVSSRLLTVWPGAICALTV